MKALLVLVSLSMVAPSIASARCRSSALYFHPKTRAKSLPTNAHILVVSYGFKDREKVGQLLDGAFFVGGRHKVPVKVQRLAQSDRAFRNAYLLVSPEKALRPRTHYRLKLAVKRPKTRPLSLHYAKLKAYRFKTGPGPDAQAPAKPSLASEGYSLRRLGCGPAESIALKVGGLADNETPAAGLRLVLEVEEKTTEGKTRRFEVITPPAGPRGFVSLGHGMCSGNYQLIKGASYAIRVAAMDWAGKRGPKSNKVTVRAR